MLRYAVCVSYCTVFVLFYCVMLFVYHGVLFLYRLPRAALPGEGGAAVSRADAAVAGGAQRAGGGRVGGGQPHDPRAVGGERGCAERRGCGGGRAARGGGAFFKIRMTFFSLENEDSPPLKSDDFLGRPGGGGALRAARGRPQLW